MFWRKPKEADLKLEKAMNRVLNEMESFGTDSPNYPNLLAHLEKLTKLQKANEKPRVSPDQMALVIGNILVVLTIVAYEQKHVMSSRSSSYTLKP